ncbi:MAG UNVERIFIED_CONTAM: hypothetical protein LVR18_41910 [Planctomycetaceae bacterium]
MPLAPANPPRLPLNGHTRKCWWKSLPRRLAADRQKLQEAELRRIDHERQQALARERELARFD